MRSISNLYHIRRLNSAILLMRIWLATVMLKHCGTYIFQEKIPELAEFLKSLNWPYPTLLAYTSQVTEFFAAVLILLGVRFGAWVMTVILGVAVLFAHSGQIYSEAELPFNYFLFSLSLSLTGCGKPSLDQVFFKKPRGYSPFRRT